MFRRGRSEGWAALAVVIGVLLLFWAPAGASAPPGAGTALPHDNAHLAAPADQAVPVAANADAAADDLVELGGAAGSTVDRVVPGRDRDPEVSGDNSSADDCGNECGPPPDDRYDRPSRERPAPPDSCRDGCGRPRPSAGNCGSADCSPRPAEPDDGGCPAPRERADCRRSCGQCADRNDRAEQPPPPPERQAPPRCGEPAGCSCGCNQAPPPRQPSTPESPPPNQPAPSSPPPESPPPSPAQPAPSPPPAQPQPSPAPPAPSPPPPEAAPNPYGSPEAPAPMPGSEAEGASATNRQGETLTNPAAPSPEAPVAGETTTALPRTGSRSRPLARVGVAAILAGLGLLASGSRRRPARRNG